ncbi:MAG TPA: c-type cytochrome domain-containing protein [Steroidobacteraceae bacterium]|nr:c-type cytochrome domain-containing protein [Steroidobacteraceae bacterium]
MHTSICRATALRLAAVALPAIMAIGCAREPPPISFHSQVAPILAKHCVSCHVEGKPGTVASALQLDSYAAVMKGTRFGPVVLPGDPLSSVMIMLVEGRADPRITMPHGGADRLTAAEIQALRDWVQQGAHDN